MSPAGTRLAALTRDLWLKWQQTRESWADSKSIEFDKSYMQELFASTDKTLAVIEQLDKLVARVRKDCE